MMSSMPGRALLSTRPSYRIVSVCCGNNHILAIGENGSLWSSGNNKYGQLGNGTTLDSYCLTRVTAAG